MDSPRTDADGMDTSTALCADVASRSILQPHLGHTRDGLSSAAPGVQRERSPLDFALGSVVVSSWLPM